MYIIQVSDRDGESGDSFWGPYASRTAAHSVTEQVEGRSDNRFETHVRPVETPGVVTDHDDVDWIVEAMR